jgi:hypothetical protein
MSMQIGIKTAHNCLPGDTTNEARENLAGMVSDLTGGATALGHKCGSRDEAHEYLQGQAVRRLTG